MVSDIYMFDLERFNWERLQQADENVPQARYFHSADTCKFFFPWPSPPTLTVSQGITT